VSADERSPDEAAREQARTEVEETLLNIEQAIRRAEQGRRKISADGSERNLRLALDRAAEQLEAVRKELFQAGYFGGEQQRLILATCRSDRGQDGGCVHVLWGQRGGEGTACSVAHRRL
jgi:hypothetical protein